MTGCQRTLSALAWLVNVLVTDTPASERQDYQGYRLQIVHTAEDR